MTTTFYKDPTPPAMVHAENGMPPSCICCNQMTENEARRLAPLVETTPNFWVACLEEMRRFGTERRWGLHGYYYVKTDGEWESREFQILSYEGWLRLRDAVQSEMAAEICPMWHAPEYGAVGA